ncbi:tRNA (adenosine(37)-N6)-threonylcarbamoyltransferase complex ATPase subunit type 1 TsaE [Candidatus Saccharibacteria bacterium]|nr:tRNA (adenosine(37)-N6)-threonylcarbamoyltransferase complex ATPase subunit type 1 TsaE [Candidatus Saccharibacteria bacterium]
MKVSSEQDMIELGAQFKPTSNVIELIGDVGTGKTTFVRGLAKSLGIKEPITSPSFTISKSYAGQKKNLVHYDFYRLNDPGIMVEDLEENIKNKDNIVVIEWSDTVKDILPKNHTIINIRYNDDGTRELEISSH